jgi:hypothetical protein
MKSLRALLFRKHHPQDDYYIRTFKSHISYDGKILCGKDIRELDFDTFGAYELEQWIIDRASCLSCKRIANSFIKKGF